MIHKLIVPIDNGDMCCRGLHSINDFSEFSKINLNFWENIVDFSKESGL